MDQVNSLLADLDSADPRIIQTAVAELERLDPERLESLVVPLLRHPRPEIQSVAIRLLFRWDREEAVRHFQGMLFSEAPADREAALVQAYFFPFPVIEPDLLRFLSITEDLGLIRQAGRLFVINPAPELPEKLVDLLGTSGGEKLTELRKILAGVVEFLVKAGLTDRTADDLRDSLSQRYRERKCRQACSEARRLLNEGSAPGRRVAVARLAELLRVGHVPARDALTVHLARETDPELISRIKGLLAVDLPGRPVPAGPMGPRVAGAGEDGGACPTETPRALAEEAPPAVSGEKVSGASSAGIDGPGSALRRNRARRDFMEAPPAARAGLLRLLVARVGPGALDLCREAVRSEDPSLVAAAAEALPVLDPSGSAACLEEALGAAPLEAQVILVQALAPLRKAVALSFVQQCLFSVQADRRRAGALAASSFDLPAVVPVLIQAMGRETEEGVFEAMAEILLEDPDEGLLRRLVEAWPTSGRSALAAGFLGRLGERVLARFPDRAATVASILASPLQGSTAPVASSAEPGCPSSGPTPAPVAAGPGGGPPGELSPPGGPGGPTGLPSVAAPRENPRPAYAFREVRKAVSLAAGVEPGGGHEPSGSAAGTPRNPSPSCAPGGPPAGEGELSDWNQLDLLGRFQALLRLGGETSSEARRNEVAGLLAREPDPGTRFHLELTLARWEADSAGDSADPPLAVLEQVLPAVAAGGEEALRLALTLERLRPRDGAVAMEMLREKSWPTLPAPLLPFLLAFVKRCGDSADGPVVEPFCRHADPRLVLGGIEALERLNPDDLRPLLVGFLVHPHPMVRFRAVRLMYKWDQPEAIRHLEATLFAPTTEERSLALEHAFFLPFPAIAPCLLRFLATEPDPELVGKAGRVFLVNPDPLMPARLMELTESCSPERRRRLEELIRGVIDSLCQAGLVSENPGALWERLAVEAHRRRDSQRLDQCRAGFRATAAETRAAAARTCETLLAGGVTEALALILEQADRETEPEVRQVLTVLVQRFAPGPVRNEVPREEWTADERNRWLATLTAETARDALPQLRRWLETLPEPEKAPVAAALGRFGPAEEVRLLRRFLKSDDPGLLAAVLGSLLAFSPELLPGILPRFLQHPADAVREAAMRAQMSVDEAQAFAWLEQMLGSGRPEQRSVGIFAAGLFSFPEVRGLLIALWERETESDNLEQLGILFRAHLEAGVLRDLVATHQEEVPALAEKERRLVALAAELPDGAELLARLRAETAMARTRTPPPYELRRIQEMRRQAPNPRGAIRGSAPPASEPPAPPAEVAAPPEPSFATEFLERYPRELAVAGALVGFMVFTWLVLFSGGSESGPAVEGGARETPAASHPIRTQPLEAGQVQDVQGGVAQVVADGVWVTLDGSGERVYVHFTGVPPREFKEGEAFRGRILVQKKEAGRIDALILRLY